jgi:RES domain-containing protein
VLQAYSLAAIRFPESEVETVDGALLPAHWRQFPSPPETQALGDTWVVNGQSLVLRVPSAIVPAASNYLINPAHPGFAAAIIEPPQRFAFDPRLLKQLRQG